MHISYMGPATTRHYRGDVILRDPEPGRDLGVGRIVCAKLSDFAHVVSRKFCPGIVRAVQNREIAGAFAAQLAGLDEHSGHQADLLRVAQILLRGNVFKVGSAVIRTVAVSVINLMAIRSPTYKRLSHERVNRNRPFLWRSAETYDEVPFAEARAQYNYSPPRLNTVPQATNTSKIRHLVSGKGRPTRTPFFGFEFFDDKFLTSHCENLLNRFELWSGSFAVQPACGPFCILTRKRGGLATRVS